MDVLRYAAALEEGEGAFYDEAIKHLDQLGLDTQSRTLIEEI